jgi:hypothetical protein
MYVNWHVLSLSEVQQVMTASIYIASAHTTNECLGGQRWVLFSRCMWAADWKRWKTGLPYGHMNLTCSCRALFLQRVLPPSCGATQGK